VLLRLAYLGVTNAFALLRLLQVSDRDKDVEILVLRHQIAVLQRQLDAAKPAVWPNRSVPRRSESSRALVGIETIRGMSVHSCAFSPDQDLGGP
jgi:hypothetical protein